MTGKGAKSAFQYEAGGHRFQRVPPTEKRGRVHTSTITVAVLSEPSEHEVKIDPRDVTEKFIRGSGKGGQHKNKVSTCVVLSHEPSGIQVRCDGGRSQADNRLTAMGILRARLHARASEAQGKARSSKRRQQIGSGMRSDKRRTIALQRDQVTDHVTGRTVAAKKYMRGNLKDLW